MRKIWNRSAPAHTFGSLLVMGALLSGVWSCTGTVDESPSPSPSPSGGGGPGGASAGGSSMAGTSNTQVVCQAGLTACGGVCVNLQTDGASCGACGNACASPAICVSGTCSTTCTAGLERCGNTCVDVRSDASNCGTCGKVCDAGLRCDQGMCSCPAGMLSCGGACVDTTTSALNCGACGVACGTGESCRTGKCSVVFEDSCTDTLATGISITDISVYQVGKIPVMQGDAAVAVDDRPADIIQGKPGRVRVFVKLESGWANRSVSARLLLTNGTTKSKYFSKRSVSAASAEATLNTTFNFDVKAEDFTEQTKYSVELVECDGTPAGTPGKARFPATDSQALGTRKTGTLKLRFIPLQANGRTAAVDTARLDAYRDYMRLMYPTSGVEYTVGSALKINQTITADGDGWNETLDQLSQLHESDDAPADLYYYGLFQPTDNIAQYCGGGCVAGIGFVANAQSFSRHQRVSFGLSFGNLSSAQTMAHEIGHNHGRPHSPCGGAAQPDAKYPYDGAKIGWWGFEAPEKLYNPASATDIMGYCNNQWVSDYTYRLFADRVALLNGVQNELPPPGGEQHFLFLLTDVRGPRWGLERQKPRYPSGEAEPAEVLDESGSVIATVTVYRTPTDHLSGAVVLVPTPEPGWHAIRVKGEVPLVFGARSSSR